MTFPGKKIPVTWLGDCACPSPKRLSTCRGDRIANYVAEDTWVPHEIEMGPETDPDAILWFEKAGPRARIYFDPAKTRAGIVTCGGLCPGLNNVIRSVFVELYYNYGLSEVLGFRYGYRGLNPARGLTPISLTADLVEPIDDLGGTILGTSRGAEDVGVMVDFLVDQGVDILFCAGGDGTLRGAHALYQEIARRNLTIAVVGIPKTIDNDVAFCERTFGYTTAIDVAREVLACAHNEAHSAQNGIGLVKLMGRDAGFIVAGAVLASQEVNLALIPEVAFSLEGERGLLRVLEQRLEARHHAVVVVAEGAGQNLFEAVRAEHDDSGNPRYNDIGLFLKGEITDYLKARGVPFDLKYIDPSYVIRSIPANSDDRTLCDRFARLAVHAAMAGRTDIALGYANGAFFHAPLDLVTATDKRVDPEGELWRSVLATTGQAGVLGG